MTIQQKCWCLDTVVPMSPPLLTWDPWKFFFQLVIYDLGFDPCFYFIPSGLLLLLSQKISHSLSFPQIHCGSSSCFFYLFCFVLKSHVAVATCTFSIFLGFFAPHCSL